jgi:hypothetical protein
MVEDRGLSVSTMGDAKKDRGALKNRQNLCHNSGLSLIVAGV